MERSLPNTLYMFCGLPVAKSAVRDTNVKITLVSKSCLICHFSRGGAEQLSSHVNKHPSRVCSFEALRHCFETVKTNKGGGATYSRNEVELTKRQFRRQCSFRRSFVSSRRKILFWFCLRVN